MHAGSLDKTLAEPLRYELPGRGKSRSLVELFLENDGSIVNGGEIEQH
jgi:hypothetical protein